MNPKQSCISQLLHTPVHVLTWGGFWFQIAATCSPEMQRPIAICIECNTAKGQAGEGLEQGLGCLKLSACLGTPHQLLGKASGQDAAAGP